MKLVGITVGEQRSKRDMRGWWVGGEGGSGWSEDGGGGTMVGRIVGMEGGGRGIYS